MTHAPLGGMSPQQFLSDYWQKRPLLIRGAFPDLQPPLSPNELAGLACEPEVESRLVLEKGGAAPWELRHGPFDEVDFAGLPPSHWTLLVQDVDKHLPEADAIMDSFRFIPDWRVDDLMISFAPAQGSVGPHVDAYDVFLLQAVGRRRWSVRAGGFDAGDVIPDIDLKVLRTFEPEEEWVLEPGDMLYLPPGVAHHGVALEDCMTCSIGFRAPSHQDLVQAALEGVIESLDPERRYTDPELTLQAEPGRVSEAAAANLRALVRGHLQPSDAELDRWLGRHLSEGKAHLEIHCPEPPLTATEFRERWQPHTELHRDRACRFLYLDTADSVRLLCVNGREHALDTSLREAAPLLCDRRHLTRADIDTFPHPVELEALLLTLYNAGCYHFDDD
jgi:50S ribosomal protein L16 3-hydroxylase